MDNVQIFIDIAFGVVTFFGGWLLKIIFQQMNRLRDDHNGIVERSREDFRSLSGHMHELAISLPEKYVTKTDLNKLLDYFNDRFDKLEDKIDQINKPG